MTCREIADDVWVCGPTAVEVVKVVEVGVKWCFRCRKRVPFTDTLKQEAGMSWYDPWWTRTCPEGHVDSDLGFGWSREYAS